MNISEIIRKKRDGLSLCFEELQYLITGYTTQKVPDYQIAAFLMAVFFRGMDSQEICALTKVFMDTGEVLDFSEFGKRSVDKHSTGGVGDKISLPLAPLVAACGAYVPMMSGRGLGHTGGTLDKLEAIPGYRTRIDSEEFKSIVRTVGCSIIGQSESLVPADKKIYALRDVTATVDSIPLIASSIMSKKIAAGPASLILDVKTGNGAFMTDIERARALATQMVAIGTGMNRQVVAIITDMNQPLGLTAGNTLEVLETIDILKNNGTQDVVALIELFGGWMLFYTGIVPNQKEGECLIRKAIEDGSGLECFKHMVKAHGGDVSFIENPDRFERAPYITPIISDRTGYISQIDTFRLGMINVNIGAGRKMITDSIDHAVGLVFRKKIGDLVGDGDTVVEVHSRQVITEKLYITLKECFSFSDAAPSRPPLVYEVIT